MIKTIYFDFGGVISEDGNSWDSMYRRIKETTGLTTEELEKIFYTDWEEISVNKKSYITFFEAIVTASKNKLTVKELLEIYDTDTILNLEIIDIIKNLKKKGYRVVLFSNDSKLGEKLRLKKAEKYVDKIYSSATLQLRKPDPKIFKFVLEAENISPNEALFIDDKLRNTVVAEKLGIKSIVYKNPKQLHSELLSIL